MVSDEEEVQFIQATHDLQEFTRGFSKKYPLLFENGYCGMKVHASIMGPPFFPYEVLLEIRTKK